MWRVSTYHVVVNIGALGDLGWRAAPGDRRARSGRGRATLQSLIEMEGGVVAVRSENIGVEVLLLLHHDVDLVVLVLLLRVLRQVGEQ